MQLFLHVGLHKTGTTAIQRFLHGNAAILKEKGYLYPQTGREGPAHHSIGYDLWQNCGRKTLPLLVQELAESSCERAIVSSEHLEYLDSAEQFAYLREQLAPFEVRVVMYLRRQDHFLASSYAQNVKADGFTCDIRTYYERTISRYDYGSTVDRWAAALGREALIVRVYEKSQLPRGLIVDFLEAVGADWDDRFRNADVVANTSLDAYGVQVMRKVNEIVNDEAERLALLKELIEKTRKMPLTNSTLVPGDLRQEILRKYAESNQHVARAFLGRQDGRLFMEPEPVIGAGEEHDSEDVDRLITVLVQLWLEARSREIVAEA